jgi:hypothetical protein
MRCAPSYRQKIDKIPAVREIEARSIWMWPHRTSGTIDLTGQNVRAPRLHQMPVLQLARLHRDARHESGSGMG